MQRVRNGWAMMANIAHTVDVTVDCTHLISLPTYFMVQARLITNIRLPHHGHNIMVGIPPRTKPMCKLFSRLSPASAANLPVFNADTMDEVRLMLAIRRGQHSAGVG